MTCEAVRIPGFGTAIVCSRRRRAPRCQVRGCDRPGVRQCDFPTAAGRSCDRYLCADHALPQGHGRDFCPGHPVVQGDLFEAAP